MQRRANVFLVLLAGIALAIMCRVSWSPGLSGDGFEYLSMSEAFVRHGTPDVRIDDLQELLRHNRHDAVIAHLGKELIDHFERGAADVVFSPGGNSRFYSYHFWLYSLVNVPATVLCQWLQIPPFNSFLLTNAILFLGLIALIAFATPWRFRRKLLLVLLALGCGSTFYLGWSGPESMCFSLLLAGLLLLETRRYGWALLAFAAAAQQNPPIGFLALAPGVIACWQAWREWRDGGWNPQITKRFFRLIPGAIVLVASPIFYWIEFGTPSLIIKAGQSHASLISTMRFISLFFDLNQGMVLAMPGVFVAVAILMPIGLKRNGRKAGLALALLAIMVVMAVPALTASNWNAGEAIITRYAYWLSAPLIYACALLTSNLPVMAFAACALALIASQAGILGFYGIRGDRYGAYETSPIADWLLDHHPSWYASVPEIFVDRGTHRDGKFLAGQSYFYVRNGYLVIVLTKSQHAYVLDQFCRVDQQRLATRGTELQWRYVYPKHHCQIDWSDGFYAFPDPPPPLKLSTSNSMGKDAGYVTDLLPGFGEPEKWGTWTVDRTAWLPLLLPDDVAGNAVTRWRITLTFQPSVSARTPMQHMSVYANGEEVLDMMFTVGGRQTRDFIAHANRWHGTQASIMLKFVIPTAISHKDLGLSGDSRRIGIGLIAVRADPL